MKNFSINQVVPIDKNGQSVLRKLIRFLVYESTHIPKELSSDDGSKSILSRPVTSAHSSNESKRTNFVKVKEKPANIEWDSDEKSDEKKCIKIVKILIGVLIGMIVLGGVVLIGIGAIGKLLSKKEILLLEMIII